MDTLSDILGAVKEPKETVVQVDITPFLTVKDPNRRVVLKWSAPDVPVLYNRLATIHDIMKQYPTWPVEMAVDVATIAACHHEPPTGNISTGQFYARIAASNLRLWQFLVAEQRVKFPHLTDQDAESLKKSILAQEAQTDQPTPSPVPASDGSTSGPATQQE